jgi:hypothetical protein
MTDNDFTVPPVVDVPTEARIRIETRVLTGIGHPRSRARLWTMAAAVAAVLVLCGLVTVTLSSDTADDNTTAADSAPSTQVPALPEAFPPALPPSEVEYEMDRCALAAQQLPNKDQYPDRRTWQSIVSVESIASKLSAIRADGKLLFCETSMKKVTLSAPDGKPTPLPGTGAGALLVTADGAIAGAMDPSWKKVILEQTSKRDQSDKHNWYAQQKDGLFFTFSTSSGADTFSVTVRPDDTAPKVLLPKSLGTSVDNPPYPPGDRTSARGKLLAQCLEKVAGAVPDAPTWQPGAMAEAGGERVIMATNPAGTSACYTDGKSAEFYPYLSTNSTSQFPIGAVPLQVPATLGGRTLSAGSMANIGARLQLVFPDKTSIDADVLNNSYAVLLPAKSAPISRIQMNLYNSAGSLFRSGPGLPDGGIANHDGG